MVRQDDQGYMILPQEMASNRLAAAAVNITAPAQSNLISFWPIYPGTRFSPRNAIVLTKPMAQMGRLIQNIHLHEAASANAPPMTGPVTDPMAHTAPW